MQHVPSESTIGMPQFKLKSQLKKQRLESGVLSNKQIQLQIYLSEAVIDESNDFDILRCWKLSSKRFLIFSKLARDVLVVLISTLASESSLNTSGRV